LLRDELLLALDDIKKHFAFFAHRKFPYTIEMVDAVDVYKMDFTQDVKGSFRPTTKADVYSIMLKEIQEVLDARRKRGQLELYQPSN